VLTTLTDWSGARTYSWEDLMTFETKNNLRIVGGTPYYCGDNGNGIVVWDENRAYAREVI